MSATNAIAKAILSLYFENADHTGIGDASGLIGSTVPGNFYVSLHTADPGETGDQTTNEATYTSYARVAVARSTAAWTAAVADPATVTNDAAITFPAATLASPEVSNTITHFGIGTDASGTGTLLFSGSLDANLGVSSGITPEFAINALTITAD
jgi:hypothetical protein